MKSILDKFVGRSADFRPTTIQDLFALRLAHKLSDGPAVRHYRTVIDRFPEGRVLAAYRQTLRQSAEWDLGRRFMRELDAATGNGGNGNGTRLLAIRIERRTVAAAVFYGDHLEFTDVRNLASVKEKALGTAAYFISWMLESFPIDSATIESIQNGHEIHRRALHDVVSSVLTDRLLPIWQVPRLELLEAFGRPALRSRRALREAITSIWPVLEGSGTKCFVQDAVAIGIFVQIERRFIAN